MTAANVTAPAISVNKRQQNPRITTASRSPAVGTPSSSRRQRFGRR